MDANRRDVRCCPTVIPEQAPQPILTFDGTVAANVRACPLDQVVVESLVIPLAMVVLGYSLEASRT